MKGRSPPRRRRSIRLEGYDYFLPGAYFVTICVRGGQCLLGQVVDGEAQLNDAGRMVHEVWNALPERYPGVGIDAFVVMPNHVHGYHRVDRRSGWENRAGTGACPYGWTRNRRICRGNPPWLPHWRVIRE